MGVAGGDHVDEMQAFGRDDDFGHAHVRLVARRVFVGERIGEVWIQQQMAALPLHEKTALAEPPEVQVLQILRGVLDVFEKFVVL